MIKGDPIALINQEIPKVWGAVSQGAWTKPKNMRSIYFVICISYKSIYYIRLPVNINNYHLKGKV